MSNIKYKMIYILVIHSEIKVIIQCKLLRDMTIENVSRFILIYRFIFLLSCCGPTFQFHPTTWTHKPFRNCFLVINIIIVRLIVLYKHFYGLNVLWYKTYALICYYLIFTS